MNTKNINVKNVETNPRVKESTGDIIKNKGAQKSNHVKSVETSLRRITIEGVTLQCGDKRVRAFFSNQYPKVM